jgi:thiamine-monophosphate kinase
MKSHNQLTEFAIIARHFAPLAAAAPGAGGLLDDAAVLTPRAGRDLVVTTDSIVEGVHFLSGEDGATVARRLLAVGFSDIAAMGAAPTAYTVALTLPNTLRGAALETWLASFAAGMRAGQEELGASLVGGDTVVAPAPLTLTLTAFGDVPSGKALRRAAAVPGDRVWVSGTIGDAALGLKVLRGDLAVDAPAHRAELVQRFRRPTARVAVGRAIAGLAHAAADVSDGLLADLGHICTASGVDADLAAASVPLSAAARFVLDTDPGLFPTILSGGDDYELVFTAPVAASAAIAAAAARLRLPLTEIGRITARTTSEGPPQVRVIDANGARLRLDRTGFTHL